MIIYMLSNKEDRFVNKVENYIKKDKLYKIKKIPDDKLHIRDDHFLIYAAMKGRLNILKYLMKKGLDFEMYNCEAINLAAYYGHYNIVKYLLKFDTDIETKNIYGVTSSFEHGYKHITKLLAKHNSDVKRVSNIHKIYKLYDINIGYLNKNKVLKKTRFYDCNINKLLFIYF